MTTTDKTIHTRKDEVRFVTDDLKKMRGQYLARSLYKTWQDTFLDEDNGEVVTVDRRELLMEAGTELNADKLQEIQFYMQTGDIKEVEVTNQLRTGRLSGGSYPRPWGVTVSVGGKKKKLLLYAVSIENAIEIAKDYVELNYTGLFHFVLAKELDRCIFIEEPAVKPAEGEIWEFYKIEVEACIDDVSYTDTFILPAKDVDNGMITINALIAKEIKERQEENGEEPKEFTTTVKAGGAVPCDCLIPKWFSEAYKPEE